MKPIKITEAEISRISHMPEQSRHDFFKRNEMRIDFAAFIRKVRHLHSVALANKSAVEAECLDDVIESAVLWLPVIYNHDAFVNMEDFK